MADEELDEPQNDGDKKTIQPQKVFLKDASFESPNSPEIFLKKWKPSLGLEIDNTVTTREEDNYEVVLSVTIVTKVEDTTAYLAEVHQAGIFTMRGFEPEHLHRLQNVFCLRYLYPFASAELSDLVTKGGFPQLLLVPLDFDRIFRGRLEEAQSKET
jgi:preprotein translocase subunit SecB